MKTKVCPRCGKETLLSEFLVRKSGKAAGLLVSPAWCKQCRSDRMREYRHATGKNEPMEKNRQCPAFLGVHIAESVLAAYFNVVIKMQYGNIGFDFICGKGFKIDVKSGCLREGWTRGHRGNYDMWSFTIGKNKIADYFLCIGFDNRKDLTPKRVWLIPGNLVNCKTDICITNSPRPLAKWSQYEHPIEKVIECCNAFREQK